MSNKLNEVAATLAQARRRKRDAERVIDNLSPLYYSLLDAEVGKGQVDFEYDGWKYGRIVAEKSVFQVDRFMADHPSIAADVLAEKVTLSLDEEALNEYLAAHPEDTLLVQQYVTTKLEPRWKPPVAAKDEA